MCFWHQEIGKPHHLRKLLSLVQRLQDVHSAGHCLHQSVTALILSLCIFTLIPAGRGHAELFEASLEAEEISGKSPVWSCLVSSGSACYRQPSFQGLASRSKAFVLLLSSRCIALCTAAVRLLSRGKPAPCLPKSSSCISIKVYHGRLESQQWDSCWTEASCRCKAITV